MSEWEDLELSRHGGEGLQVTLLSHQQGTRGPGVPSTTEPSLSQVLRACWVDTLALHQSSTFRSHPSTFWTAKQWLDPVGFVAGKEPEELIFLTPEVSLSTILRIILTLLTLLEGFTLTSECQQIQENGHVFVHLLFIHSFNIHQVLMSYSVLC